MKRRITTLIKTVGLIGLAFLVLLFAEEKPFLQAAEPIKIGAVLSMTGWAGAMGTATKEGITIVAEEINRRGGVLGRPIELYLEDDQSNPTTAVIATTKLIRDRKVCLIIGPAGSSLCMAVIPTIEREQVPNLAIGSANEITVPLKKWVFRLPLTDYIFSPMMLKFAVGTFGARKIAILHSTDSTGMMGAKGIIDNAGKYGVSLVIIETFDPKDTNMIPQLMKVKAANPDAILLYTTATAAPVIAKNYYQLGMKHQVLISHSALTEEFLKLAGKILEERKWIGFATKSLYGDKLPPDDPWRKNVFDPFKKALKEKYGKEVITGFYGNAHDAMHIAIEALKIAGRDDRAALRDALEKVRYKDGLLADFAYSPSDHDGQSGEAEVAVIVKDGEWWPYKK